MHNELSLPDDLPAEDRIFHSLARALDGIPPEKQQLFLAKLALLLSVRLPAQELEPALAIAALDL